MLPRSLSAEAKSSASNGRCEAGLPLSFFFLVFAFGAALRRSSNCASALPFVLLFISFFVSLFWRAISVFLNRFSV
jgi:hypothetical protein